MQSVYLAECGTHAIVEAGFWPCHTSERLGAFRVLRSVTSDMLVMWDRGLHDFDMLVEVGQRGAHALDRLPAHVKPTCVERLADDSILAYLYPSDPQRRKRGEHRVVRLMVRAEEWPRLYQRLLEDIVADGKLPKRRPRSNPRVLKRKMSKWRLKRPEHNRWPKPTRPFCEAVAFS